MTRVGTAGIERAPVALLRDPALCAAWDQRAVDAPGGDMHQGSAFAADRERRGIKALPLYVDGTPLLVTIRRIPILGLGTASVSRGPAVRVDAAPEEILRIPELLRRVAHWLRREEGVVEMRVDTWAPESAPLREAWSAAGFSPCEESFFSRHAMWIKATATPGITEEELFSQINATKRNEVSAARRAGVTVHRLTTPDEAQLSAVAAIVNETAVRRGFTSINVARTLPTWADLMRAGQMEVWLAELPDGRIAAVETALRHGERLTSHHAGSRELGEGTPVGVVPLLRWTLINQARLEGRIADLGGADIAGHRSIPEPGDRMYGLYTFKRAFGASWMEMSGAHRIEVNPLGARVRGLLRRAAGGTR
ncbi:MAG: lipid II:glycine glycyltransferase FemX [Candidatus Limnocylindrus sp.]